MDYLCRDNKGKSYGKRVDMKSQSYYINLLRDNSEKLHNDFGITFMRLFGSVAKNKHNENSDVDLFVKMPPVFYNAIAAAQFLEELLGCKVDLICDHDNLNPFFRNQIDKYGIDIFRTTGIVA